MRQRVRTHTRHTRRGRVTVRQHSRTTASVPRRYFSVHKRAALPRKNDEDVIAEYEQVKQVYEDPLQRGMMDPDYRERVEKHLKPAYDAIDANRKQAVVRGHEVTIVDPTPVDDARFKSSFPKILGKRRIVMTRDTGYGEIVT